MKLNKSNVHDSRYCMCKLLHVCVSVCVCVCVFACYITALTVLVIARDITTQEK